MVRKLLWVALLAVVLVPLGASVSEAAIINCVSGGVAGANGAACAGSAAFQANSGPQSFVWRFYQSAEGGSYDGLLYEFGIAGDATSDFTLAVTDYWSETFRVGSPNDPGSDLGYTRACVPTYSSGECALFSVFPSVTTPAWDDGYNVTISWFVNDDPMSRPDSATILKTNDNWASYSELAEIWYNPYPDPGNIQDPAIGGKGDTFSTFGVFTPGVTPVPEPASLLLLGTGLAGAWLGRRRRR